VLELLLATLSALLNLTTLAANQPRLARCGLATLLCANTSLHAAIMDLVGRAPGRHGSWRRLTRMDQLLCCPVSIEPIRGPPTPLAGQASSSPGELRALDLLAAILQNLAAHPDNRTRLYRAELSGTAALERALEMPSSPEPSEGRLATAGRGAAFRSLLLARTGHSAASTAARAEPCPTLAPDPGPALPAAAAGRRSPIVGQPLQRAGAPESGPEAPCPRPCPTAAAVDVASQQRRTAAGSSGRPDDPVLAAASVVRPKVLFPSIMQHQGNVAAATASVAAGSPAPLPGASTRPQPPPPGSLQPGAATAQVPATGGSSSPDLRRQFLAWLDGTLAAGDAAANELGPGSGGGGNGGGGGSSSGSGGGGGGALGSCGLADRASLQRLLCRPLQHLWQGSPEALARQGARHAAAAGVLPGRCVQVSDLTRPAPTRPSTLPPARQRQVVPLHQ
jgi:hypothetical protein